MDMLITGWGVLSSLGSTREEFTRNICCGRSGIAPIQSFDTSALGSHLAATLRDPIGYKRHIAPSRLRRMDRLTRQLVYVACEAFHHAGLNELRVPPERRAVVLACGMNNTESIEQFYVSLLQEGPEGANPILFPATIPNSPAGLIAIELECRGPNLTITQKETSAEAGLVAALGLLQNDEADVVLLVAGESLTPVVYEGLAELRALSRSRTRQTAEAIHELPGQIQREEMRPFSRRRNGFVAGEGSAAVVLERLHDRQGTDRPSLGRLIGAAECCQPCSPVKYPTDPLPMVGAVESLLKATGRDPASIAFVNSAANATFSLDACEAEAIRRVTQKLGRCESDLPVAAVKAQIGEFCAGGLTRILAAFIALETGICPPLPFEAKAYDCEFTHLRLSYQDMPPMVRDTDFLHLATATGGHQMVLWFSRGRAAQNLAT